MPTIKPPHSAPKARADARRPARPMPRPKTQLKPPRAAARADDDGGSDAISAALSRRIKALRAERQMTLDELSKRCKVSRAMLSKVERGEKSPTLPIVVRIAGGFGLSLSSLLGAVPDMSEVCVIRAAERLSFRDAESGFERWVLSPAHLDNGVEVVLHRIPPGRSSGVLPPYAVPTEKYIAVADGQLTVYVDSRPYVLKAGDSMYFEVKTPYRLVNDDGHVGCSYYMFIVRKR